MSCAALGHWLQRSRAGMRLLRGALCILLLQFTLGAALHAQTMSHGMPAMTQQATQVNAHCVEMASDADMMSMSGMPMDAMHMHSHSNDVAADPHDAAVSHSSHGPDCCQSSLCQCACMIMPMVSMQWQMDVLEPESMPLGVLNTTPRSRPLLTPFRPPIQ